MRKFGLYAAFKFTDAGASAKMGQTAKKVGLLKTSLRGIKSVSLGVVSGLKKVALGVVGLASKIGLLAGGVGIGAAISKFADFQGQMGVVKSVLGKEAAPQFAALEAKAKELGETTQFTAVESAAAMENLARAGFNANQITAAIGPTLNAAAADGLDLATAADIVASNIKAFGLEAKDAAMVADTLAYVSSKTNTNMSLLQEGMKFAAPVAKELGINLQDTAATMGILADVGLKGTLAGTSFKNAMLQIANSAKGGRIQVGGISTAIAKLNDGSVDVTGTFRNIIKSLGHLKDPTERASAAMKLLGLRGIAVPSAFRAAMKDTDKMNKLFNELEKNANGAAERMAKMRLDNIKGDFTKLKSATEGVLINFGAMLGSIFGLRGGIQGMTSVLSQLSKTFGFFAQNPEQLRNNELAIDGVSGGVLRFVKGILNAIEIVKSFFRRVSGGFSDSGSALGSFVESVGNLLKALTGTNTVAEAFNQIGVIIGATFSAVTEVIKLLAMVVDEAAKKFNKFVDFLPKFGEAIGDTVFEYVQGAKKIGQSIGNVANKAYSYTPSGAIINAIKPVKDALINRNGMLPVSAGDVVLDRASLAGAITSNMRGGLAPSISPALGQGDPGRVTPPPAQNVHVGGEININVPLMIDGRQVALAVARAKLSDLERQGATPNPGDRASLLQRGFKAAF